MAGSYEQLLKQQEIYKKQLKDIEFQENSKELEDLLLGDETNQAIKRLEAYGRPLSLFIELLYKELYGTPFPYSNEDIVNRSGDALNRFYSIDPSFKSKSFSPDDLIVKETNKIVEVKKAVLDNGSTKDNYETVTSYSSSNVKLSILTGDEYRENLGNYYDGNQFNFVMDNYFNGEDEILLQIINWYKETYETIGNIYYDQTAIKQFTCGAENIETFNRLRDIELFLTNYFLIRRDSFRLENLVSSARKKTLGGYQTNEEFVERILEPFLPEGVTQIKKINFIFSFETMNRAGEFSKEVNFIEKIQKIHKYFNVDEIEIIFLDLGIRPEKNKITRKIIHKNLKDYFFKIETKSENKQVLKKPIKKTATKKFPKQIIVDPKKNKPVRRKKSSNVLKKKKRSKTIPSKQKINKTPKFNTNKEYQEEKAKEQIAKQNDYHIDYMKRINSMIPYEGEDFNLSLESRREEARIKNENQVYDHYEPSLGNEIDKHIQKSKEDIEKINYAMLENKVISSINTENYSKVNTMISVLTERERENQRRIDELEKSIIDFKRTNEDQEELELLKEEKQELEALKIEYQQAINTLLPILSTMNSKKFTNVKYNRAKQDDIKKMKFFFEEDGIDVGLRKLEEVQSSLNDGTNKPYKDGEYIYFNYKEFLEMKEIKEIIEYNRKKYKKGRK